MKVFTSSKYSFLYIKNYRNIKYSYRIYCFSKKILTNPILLLSTTCVNIVFSKNFSFLVVRLFDNGKCFDRIQCLIDSLRLCSI